MEPEECEQASLFCVVITAIYRMQHPSLLPGKHAHNTWPLSKPAACHVHLVPQLSQQHRLYATLQNSSAEQQPLQQSQRAFRESISEPGSVVHQILSDPGIEGDALKFLKVTDAYWSVSARAAVQSLSALRSAARSCCLQALRKGQTKRAPTVVRTHTRRLRKEPKFDVCMCGGTLGLLLALALQASQDSSACAMCLCGF